MLFSAAVLATDLQQSIVMMGDARLLHMEWNNRKGGEGTISIAIITNSKEELLACCQVMIQKGSYQNIHSYTNPYMMLEEITEIDCDVVLVDMELKEMNALELSARLLKCKPGLKMVLLSESDQGALEALQMGARDFLRKPLTVERLQQTEIKIGLQ